MKKKKLIIFGVGGHTRSCIDIAENSNFIIEFLVCDKKKSTNIFYKNYKQVVEKELKKKYQDVYGLVGVGQIKTSIIRKKIFNLMKKMMKPAIILSKKSYVSKKSKIGDGTIVMHGCNINANVFVGKNCIINTGAIIEHDSYIGDNTHISTGAIINGNVKIGKECFIGSGSVIRESIVIKDHSVIKMGSIIKKDVV
jgi:sugar O-acyltransferase (sialic acid O-acetyltransferase NeuD family)